MSRENSNENSEYGSYDSDIGTDNDTSSDTGSDSEHDIYTESKFDSENGSDTVDVMQTDKHGFLVLRSGQLFGSYKIRSVLGEGAFGRVFQVENRVTGQYEALKIGKNDQVKRKFAMREIIALTIISCRDPNNTSLCIKMLNWFNYNGHICISFPALGVSVFDFMKQNKYIPFAVDEVRHIAHQVCSAVLFLHKNGITHTDLKPENLLFLNSSYTTELNSKNKEVRRIVCTDIRLIDFGNAVRDDDPHYLTVTTTYYRAPEVTLKLGWSHPCDVWSIGCTLFEIYYGNLLFPSDTDREQVIMLERTLGPIPVRLTSASSRTFITSGKIDIKLNEKEEEVVDYSRPLNEFQLSDSDDDFILFDLIKRMLEYDPINRITLKKALQHSFFHKLPLHQLNRHKNSRK